MNLSAKRLVAVGASVAVAVGTAGLVGASSASAVVNTTVLGTLGVSGTSSPATTADNFSFTTDVGCPANDGGSPATATNNARVVMNGGDAGYTWPNVTLVGNTATGVNHSGAQSFPIGDSFNGIAAAYGLPAPRGTYTVTLYCQNATGTAVSGVFQSRLIFSAASPNNTFTVAAPVIGAVSTQGTAGPGTGGNTADIFNFTTSVGCPSYGPGGVATNNALIKIDGGATGHAWSNITVVANTSSGVSHSGAQSFPIADSFNGLKAANGLPTLEGSYTLTLYCQNSTGSAVSGVFTSPIFFTAGTPDNTFALNNSYTTTTGLSSSAGSVTVGANVTLTAALAASGGTLPAGTVTFKEGSTTLGTPQAVTSGATSAAVTINSLTVGSHTVVAQYDPTNAALPADQFAGSSSLPLVITVTKKDPVPTVQISPASPNIYTPVSISCGVTGGVSGPSQVTFTYTVPGGSATTSSAVNLSAGSASLSLGTLSAGTLADVKCTTVADANNSAVASSVIAATSIAGIDPTRVATQYVDVTVNPGTLTLTVQGVPVSTSAKGSSANAPSSYPVVGNSANVVILPAANLNDAGTFIVTEGNMLPVQAVDTRAGDPGYAVTGLLSDLVQPAGATHPGDKINASNFGWTPAFISSTRVPSATSATLAGLTDGGVTAPANGLLSGVSSSLGLGGSAKTLYTAPAGQGSGTVVYGAKLSMKAPTTTRDGLYEGVLTLTAG